MSHGVSTFRRQRDDAIVLRFGKLESGCPCQACDPYRRLVVSPKKVVFSEPRKQWETRWQVKVRAR